ncbi:MAG: cbb3-type cytochrome c oxidase N-terminal domain-containing protein [Kofleriaceae bacterium]
MTANVDTATTDHDLADEGPENARLMTHAYDGIREYDNPLPGWWSLIFAGSIAFAAAYGFYYHVAHWGKTPAQTYATALADYDGKRELREQAEAANVSEQTIANAAQDPKTVERGIALFAQRCTSCHADKGQGLIGPNLTDLRQIHGSTRMDLYTTISKGVPTTAMLAWGEQLPQTDVLALAAYVTTLRGQNIAGKEPQGSPVEKF